MEFLSLHTEASYDEVDVYNGSNFAAELIGSFSGDTLPDDIFSDNPLFINFHTDGSAIRKGFKIRYTIRQNKPGKKWLVTLLNKWCESGTPDV